MYLLKSSWACCDTRSIFKQSLTGLNSESSSSWTSCHTKVKKNPQSTQLFSPAIGQTASLLFYKDGFGIKWLTKVDIPLNKDIKETNEFVYKQLFLNRNW